MSYYIVRDLKVIPNPNDETGLGYLLQYRVADSNCFNINYDRRGRRYETHCEYTGTSYEPTEKNNFRSFTKEEIEKDILEDYFKGNYHCGNNKYNRFIKKVGLWFDENSGHHPMLNRYYELDKKIDKLHRRLWSKKRNKESNFYKLCLDVSNKLYEEKRNYLRETLYTLFTNPKLVREYTTKVTPFIVKDKDGFFITKLNRSTYRRTPYRDNAKVFKDVKTLRRVSNNDFYSIEIL